ncbi:hypothetical protein NL319_28625, partial [Klebsiella pneumoniae]|nr:hypothetical protein [Klebsiella pneumoniae]
LNDRLYHEQMKTAIHDSSHILNPPTTTLNVSSLETRGQKCPQSQERLSTRPPDIFLFKNSLWKIFTGY